MRPLPEKKTIDRLPPAEIQRLSGAKIEVKDFETGATDRGSIAIRLFSDDLDTLRALSFRVEDLLKKTEGTIYIITSSPP